MPLWVGVLNRKAPEIGAKRPCGGSPVAKAARVLTNCAGAVPLTCRLSSDLLAWDRVPPRCSALIWVHTWHEIQLIRACQKIVRSGSQQGKVGVSRRICGCYGQP